MEERDNLSKELNRLRSVISSQTEKKQRLNEKKIEFTDMLKYSDQEILAQKEAYRRESQRKDRIVTEIEELSRSINMKKQEMVNFTKNKNEAESALRELERSVRDQRVSIFDRFLNYDVTKSKITSLYFSSLRY